MAEYSAQLVSPLRHVRSSSTGRGNGAIKAAEYANLGYIILRGRLGDSEFISAVSSVLEASLPSVPRAVSRFHSGVILWQSPDEWWLICARTDLQPLVQSLRHALEGVFSQVVDNSGGLTALHLSGTKCLTLLRHLSPYDFDSLSMGQCVSTVIGKANFTVVRTEHGVTLIFRRSFAMYIWDLIDRAATPYQLDLVDSKSTHDGVFSHLLASTENYSPVRNISDRWSLEE